MARVGRKPKPSSLRLVEGKRGHRPIPREVQPRPVGRSVSSPVFLSASAKKEWKRVVNGLQRLGLYIMMDHAALATYCQAFGNWHDAQEWLNKVVRTIADMDGSDDLRSEDVAEGFSTIHSIATSGRQTKSIYDNPIQQVLFHLSKSLTLAGLPVALNHSGKFALGSQSFYFCPTLSSELGLILLTCQVALASAGLGSMMLVVHPFTAPSGDRRRARWDVQTYNELTESIETDCADID